IIEVIWQQIPVNPFEPLIIKGSSSSSSRLDRQVPALSFWQRGCSCACPRFSTPLIRKIFTGDFAYAPSLVVAAISLTNLSLCPAPLPAMRPERRPGARLPSDLDKRRWDGSARFRRCSNRYQLARHKECQRPADP